MKEGISKGMNMKWSLYMSSNQQNLTIGSIGLKSDYRVVKISLTTGLGSYPGSCLNSNFLAENGLGLFINDVSREGEGRSKGASIKYVRRFSGFFTQIFWLF